MSVAAFVVEGDIAMLRQSFSTEQMRDYVVPGTFLVRDRTFKDLPLLHFAVLYHKMDVAHFLLSSSVNPDLFCNEGMTALHLAVFLQMKDMTELLLFYNACNTVPDKFGHSPLLYAISNCDTEIVHSLLMAGAMDKSDVTALHMAIAMRQPEIVRLLMKYGANPNEKNHVGKTAFELLKLPEDKEFEDIMKNTKPDEPSVLTAPSVLLPDTKTISFGELLGKFPVPPKKQERPVYSVTKL